ncbi:MAG TPA: S-adenosylmethionine decarboxylase [Planctomycetota bacterium]|nr:S-adenosylmethionine decarboxylase [Planctomycetota bacterium]
MNEKLWAILDARERHTQASMDVIHQRLSELNNDAIGSSVCQGTITALERENQRLRDENAALTAQHPEEPGDPYGYELILDLHGCDIATCNRASLRKYFKKLCRAIDMERCDLHFWDDVGVPRAERQTSPHTKGTSAVQFILTSTVVVHTLPLLGAAYINIFSCKAFDSAVAEQLTKKWFGATECRRRFMARI